MMEIRKVEDPMKLPRCRECGKEFVPKRDWQEYCCTQHLQRWHYQQRKLQRKQIAAEAAEDAREDRVNGNGYTNGRTPQEEKIDVVALLKLVPAKPINRRRIVSA